jgi:hypothetical protein
MSLAHESSMTEQLDVSKTSNRILAHFYWPNERLDVVEECRSCNTCQVIGKPNQTIRVAPLRPVPVPAFEESFSRVIVECVGPLLRLNKEIYVY